MSRRYPLCLLTIVLLVSSILFINLVYSGTPTMYVTPGSIIGDLNPAPGSIITTKVNASNIPSPGLWGHEFYMALDKQTFPETIPITNMNFTTNDSGWAYTSKITTGTETHGWDGTDGNPSPGSGLGSAKVRGDATGTQVANMQFNLTSAPFTWSLGAPPDFGCLLSFAVKASGVSAPASQTIILWLVKPGGGLKAIGSKSVTRGAGWTYVRNYAGPAGDFATAGQYRIIIQTYLTTSSTALGSFNQVNLDDIGLLLAPISATEGQFLRAQPPVLPLSNMNFTTDSTGWTTTTTVTTGTASYGRDATDGNTNPPGSGIGSYFHKATSTITDPANIYFATEQSFTWDKGKPLNAYLSYAYKVSGNSFYPTEDRKSPTTSGTGTWTSPGNAFSSDNAYATTSVNGSSQVYQDYSFSIPAGATITRVELGWEAYTTGDERLNLTVSWNAGTNWATIQTASLPGTDPNTIAWHDFTSATSWDSTKLSNTNFRAKIAAYGQGSTMSPIYVDWLPVRITFLSGYVDLQIVKPDNAAISLITPITFNATKSWTYLKNQLVSTTVFSQSGTYKFRMITNIRTASSGTSNYAQVNLDDVGLKLLIAGGASQTYLVIKYYRYATNNTLYFADTMMGTPYTEAVPVIGEGTIAIVKFQVGYGKSTLDLYKTKMYTLGDPPGYPVIEFSSHIAVDGYFDNRILGDISGPESPPGSGLYPYDGKVSIYDLNYLGKAFGTANVTADFTGPENPLGSGSYPPDGIVDVRDLHALGKNYGRQYP